MELIKLEYVEEFDNYLDSEVALIYKGQPLGQDWARISKVAEELGEAIQAFIGYTGQNPRKGSYDSLEHVEDELADVALTAIYAIQHFTKNVSQTRDILDASQAKHVRYMKRVK